MNNFPITKVHSQGVVAFGQFQPANTAFTSHPFLFSDTLNKKGCEVNAVLMEMCREKNIYLIDNSKKVKPQHINKGKLHLNQKGSRLLSDMFLKEISRVFN